MPVADVLAEGRRWLRWAEEDLKAAEEMQRSASFRPRHACWYAQQAAEKAIKAALVFEQIAFPFSHDLEQLRELVPSDWEVRRVDADLASLTPWSVEARYPLRDEPTVEDARDAVAEAERVLSAVRRDLRTKGYTNGD
jgi:HEPN domain-containing protein